MCQNLEADLAIKNTKIVFSSTIVKAGLAVKNGKIIAITSDENLPKADKIIDAKENLTLPGIIDVHVHFREPGFTRKEDFFTGSMAAVFGGVTTVVDMPNTNPPTLNLESFRLKIEKAKGKTYVNLGFFGGVCGENLDKIQELAKAGVLGYKIFMDKVLGKPLDDNSLIEAFKLIAKTGLRVAVHAEDPKLVEQATLNLKKTGRKDFRVWVESRPSLAEAKAIEKLAFFSHKTGCKIHICHVSSKMGVEVLRKIKSQLSKIFLTSETCPHYLLLSFEEAEKVGLVSKIVPPIRFKEDKENLWYGLLDGTIDIIASDHSPHLPEDKAKDVWDAATGFVGVETSLPLMLTQVNLGRLTINHYVKISAENPAKAFGLYPKKGFIQVGSDADLTIVDLKKESTIKSENLHSKTRLTPFEGWKVKGLPTYTIVNGKIMMENGEITGKPEGNLILL
ncbi:allantoinase AllB [Candidatus Bathyarchaeota archaeon]|nr:MAG: allantoinase AllB [Candidatus Bathyarchaeota archaeon]